MTSVGEAVEKSAPSCIAGGNVKCGKRCGKVWWLFKMLNIGYHVIQKFHS